MLEKSPEVHSPNARYMSKTLRELLFTRCKTVTKFIRTSTTRTSKTLLTLVTLVYLDSEHIKTLSAPGTTANELQALFLGPFKIIERPSSLNYKLDLPPKSRIHPFFHLSKLRKHVPRDSNQFVLSEPTDAEQEPLVPDNPEYYQEEYEVEKIIKHTKSANGFPRFLVKWVGYPHSENTWQTVGKLVNAQGILDQ